MFVERTRCEVYSRVVGYIRPVSQWNDGKQSEFKDRIKFDKSIHNIHRESVKGDENEVQLEKGTCKDA